MMTELTVEDKSQKTTPSKKEPPDEINKIKKDLMLLNAPKEITDHIQRYDDSDVPIIYSGNPHEVTYGSGGKDYGRKANSYLVVGMKAPIYEEGAKYADQNPNVIAQWRGLDFLDGDKESKGIEREEVEQIKQGVYVTRKYKNVSGLGKFDGELVRIALQVESGEFHPQSNYPGRKEYRVSGYTKREDGTWGRVEYGSTFLLNGASELKGMHLGEIVAIKNELPTEVKQISSAQELVEESEKIEKRLTLLLEKNQQIINEMRKRMEDMYRLSISQLDNTRVLTNAVEMMQDGVLSYPERVFIAGRVLSIFSGKSRFELAQALAKEGKQRFKNWYEEKRLHDLFDNKSNLRKRILDKNLYHFIQFWDIHTKGEFYEPDWKEMDHSHQLLTSGRNESLYPLYHKTFNGMQTSALECFIEDEVIEKVMGEETKHPRVLPRIIE